MTGIIKPVLDKDGCAFVVVPQQTTWHDVAFVGWQERQRLFYPAPSATCPYTKELAEIDKHGKVGGVDL
jgi:hypothetical protein